MSSRLSLRRVLLWMGLTLAVVFAWAPPAHAQTRTIEALVRGQPTTISQNEVVEDVLVMGHNVTVEGRVTELLVVLDGDVHLTSTARTGIVVDIGGVIRQDRGAHVEGVYRLSLNAPFWNGTLFGLMVAFGLWAASLAVSVVFVLVAVLIAAGLAGRRLPLASEDASVRRLGLLGVFMTLAVLSVVSLLGMTVIALPLAGIVLAAYVVAGVVGLSAVSLWVGRLVMRGEESRPTWALSLAGAGLMAAFMNIPLIGIVLLCLFWLIGVGCVTQVLLRRRRSR